MLPSSLTAYGMLIPYCGSVPSTQPRISVGPKTPSVRLHIAAAR
jgi:hypothetical protein